MGAMGAAFPSRQEFCNKCWQGREAGYSGTCINFLGVDLHYKEFANTAIPSNQNKCCLPLQRSHFVGTAYTSAGTSSFLRSGFFSFLWQTMYANNIAESVDHILE